MQLPVLAWAMAGLLAAGQEVGVEGRDSAAITAAIGRAGPGDTVRLPAGAYAINEPVKLKTGVRLIGAGQGETVLRYTGERPGAVLLLLRCEDVEIGRLAIDGAGNPMARQGVYACDSRRLNIHHVTVRHLLAGHGFGPHGIHFNGRARQGTHAVTDSTIADCTLEDIGVGASFGGGVRLSWGSSRNRVLRNTIRKTGRGGIFADNGSSDLVIRGNTVAGSGGTGLGIEIWGRCDRCVIEDNTIDHWLSVGGCDVFAVRRNTVAADDGTTKPYGLEIIGSYGVVTDNQVGPGQGIGVSVSGKRAKQYVFYALNTIRQSYHWGAQLQGEAGGIAYHYFYRCKFLDTLVGHKAVRYKGHEGNGFRTNGRVRHLVLEDCEIRANARYGLQLGGADVDGLRFVRCTIADNRGRAVVGPRAYTHLEWVDCTVKGNRSDTLPPAKPGPGPAPVARLTAPGAARTGEPVRFGAASEADAVLWDLGDGPPKTEREVTHVYTRPGVYRVTLVVWDKAGQAARAERTIRVEPAR